MGDDQQVVRVTPQPEKKMSPLQTCCPSSQTTSGQKPRRLLAVVNSLVTLSSLRQEGSRSARQVEMLLAQVQAREACVESGMQEELVALQSLRVALLNCGQNSLEELETVPVESAVKLWQISMSVLSIILFSEVLLLPFTHCSLFSSGAAEQYTPSFEEVVFELAACCVQLFRDPTPSRCVQKLLSTTFNELPELQGPLKPELFQKVVPDPCRPIRTTMSASLTPGRPAPSPSITVVGWLVSVEGRVQLARPSGKLPSTSSAEVPAGLSPLPQTKEGVELEKGAELLPALMAQARALDSTRAQQSLLERQAERVEQLEPLLEKATLANSATKLSPRLSELVRLREASQPPMQSWKAVLSSFLMGGTVEVVVNQVASMMSSRSSITEGVISGVEWWTDSSLQLASRRSADRTRQYFMEIRNYYEVGHDGFNIGHILQNALDQTQRSAAAEPTDLAEMTSDEQTYLFCFPKLLREILCIFQQMFFFTSIPRWIASLNAHLQSHRN